jgi:hypothetical protein
MVFPDRLRFPFSFDPGLLARDLAALADVAWYNHVAKLNYDGRWDVIALRASAGETHPSRMIVAPPGATVFADTPHLARCSYFQEVLASFACPLRGARVMRLTAGSVIKTHFDPEAGIEDGQARLHIPILTNPDVDFRLNDVRVDMAPGSVWYLRFSDPHAVANRGTTDRVHLVIDTNANDWLMGFFADAAHAPATV